MEVKNNIKIYSLTPREIEVIKLLAQFKNNKTISDELFISESTVKAHISSILRKLNVSNRFQCVLICLKTGIIKPDDIKIQLKNR